MEQNEQIAKEIVEQSLSFSPEYGSRGNFMKRVFVPLMTKALDAKDLALKDQLAAFQESEKKLSDAYLRIRGLVDAWKTPYAPTSEQLFELTENCLKERLDAGKKAGEALIRFQKFAGDCVPSDAVSFEELIMLDKDAGDAILALRKAGVL